MTDLGKLKSILGIQVEIKDKVVTMSQQGYVEQLLEKFNMVDSNPVSTPEVVGQVLEPSKLNPSEMKTLNLPYRELVGSLQYLVTCTRPMRNTQELTSAFMHCPYPIVMSPTITHAKKEDKSTSLIFDGGKFNIYKVRIQAELRGKGLWTVVSGEYTREDAEDEVDFDSKEDKAFDILVNSLDDDNLAYVSHVTTSKEVWDMLVTRYEARTYADVSHVIHELHTKVFSLGSSMQKHVTDMRGLQQKLLLMGSRVDDDMLGRILLTSVKEAFPTTVEILRSREPSPTLIQITNRLLAKEDEVKSNTTTKRKADDEQLLYTGKPDKPRPFKKQVVKDKCHYCHKIGHHAFECRFKKRDLAKGITRKCMPTDEDQINILQHDDDDDEGFILATLGDVPLSDIEDAWILDSACTADVTGNKALFTKLARTQ
ncbi:hypothetical protein As57867_019079, partial [Aphanomyces stellatus]